MKTKKNAEILSLSLVGIFILLIVLINYFALYNESVRNEIIEILLPVLERFLHQPEIEISSIGQAMHG